MPLALTSTVEPYEPTRKYRSVYLTVQKKKNHTKVGSRCVCFFF